MEGRERSEQAPVVLGHGEHALRRGVSHGGARRISKRDPHRGSIDAETAQQVRLSNAGLVAHWRRQRHGGERAEQRRLTLRQWRRRELGSEWTDEAKGRG